MAAAFDEIETGEDEKASFKQEDLISFSNHCCMMANSFDDILFETKVRKNFLTKAEKEIERRIISESKVLEIVILILNETYAFMRNVYADFISLDITKEKFDEIQDSVKKNQENIRRTKDVVFETLTEVKKQKINLYNYIGNREEYIKNTYIEEANQLELEYTWFSKRIHRKNEFINAQKRLKAKKDDAEKAKNYLCESLMVNLQNIIRSFDQAFGTFNMIYEGYKDREIAIIKAERKDVFSIFMNIQKDMPLYDKLFKDYSRAEFTFRSTLFVITDGIDCQYICDRLEKIKKLLRQTNMSDELWRKISERIHSYRERIGNLQTDAGGSR